MSTTGEKTRQAQDQILHWIQAGRFAPGQQMPSEQSLARELGINHQTLRRGLGQLARQGWIVKRPRVGNFVAETVKPALVVPHVAEPVAVAFPSYFTRYARWTSAVDLLLEGVHQALDPFGHPVVSLRYHPERFAQDVCQMMLGRGIRGLILHGHRSIPVAEVRHLLTHDVKVVLTQNDVRLVELGLPSFFIDLTSGLAALLAGLQERGHEKPTLVTYSHTSHDAQREAALRQIGQQFGLGEPGDFVVRLFNAESEVDFSALDRLLNARPLPTALIAADEVCAAQLLRRCYQRGIWVPRDLSVAVLHDLAPGMHPMPLTGYDCAELNQHKARLAAAHLRELLLDTPMQPLEMRLRVKSLVWTDSIRDMTAKMTAGNRCKETSHAPVPVAS